MKKTAIVFSHAHWDIEWYLPFRSFRPWLVKIVNRLIDPVSRRPGFKAYMLDGQVAPVEHYLAVHPGRAPDVRKLIRAGKLAIGPFYTQFDEWLISPESIVHNALCGDRQARRFGARPMKAGYLPDNFGHPRQMPQILAGFGLGSLIFMRGMPERPAGVADQFQWIGLDGTRILGIHMPLSYAAAVAAGSPSGWPQPVHRTGPYGDYTQTPEPMHRSARHERIEEGAAKLVEVARQLAGGCPTGVIPIPNGCDHAPAQERIGDIIARANAMQDEIRFVHADVGELTRRVAARGRNLPDFDGDLYGGRFMWLLTGTLATRAYLKQANFMAEAMLEKYAEPLAAMAMMCGWDWPGTLLAEAWRFMFHNQAHDGIHGSSMDAVHVEMEQRYEAARQIALNVCHEAMASLAAQRDAGRKPDATHTPVLVYNPVSAPLAAVPVEFWHTAGEGTHLEDARGRIVPSQIVANPWAGDPPRKDSSWTPDWPDETTRHVVAVGPVAPGGLATWRLAPGKASTPPMGRQSDTTIANEFLRVSFRRGALEIYDKATRRVYAGVGLVEDEADDGDAWDFSEPWKANPILRSSAFPATCRLVESGPVRATLEIIVRMRVPERIERGKRARHTVDMPLTARVSLWRGMRRVDVALEFYNLARDHRMRLVVPTGVAAATVKSQCHFGVQCRPLRNPDEGRKGWSQPPPVTFPFREWVAVDDGRAGLAVVARGLYEYESRAVHGGGVCLWLTLMRCYGRMSRAAMRSRAGATSPTVPVEGAQCLRSQRFEFSFIPYSGACGGARAPFAAEAQAFLFPPLAHVVAGDHVLVEPKADRGLPAGVVPAPIVGGLPANLPLSCIKRAEDEKAVIVRLWENEGRRTVARLELASCFGRVVETNLNEQPLRELKRTRAGVTIIVNPYRIVTLKLYPRKGF